ncbi:hypothetical protein [Winogradskyella sp. 4-2091]|uniref:hypothetical protein n=1 Tax=Winogradskyella sp. 4-2091 TaxID=3381659 RepID=UPI003892A4DD
MKITIIIFFCSVFQFAFCQKKIVYANDSLTIITKSEYDNVEETSYLRKLKFQTDSLLIYVNTLRFRKGKISTSLLDSIRTKFSLPEEVDYDDKKLLIIHYLPKNDYTKYQRKSKKLNIGNHIFVNQLNAEIRGFGSEIQWIQDPDMIIENTFFIAPYPCGGFVIIDYKGNYFTHRFEYHPTYVFKIIKENFKDYLLIQNEVISTED